MLLGEEEGVQMPTNSGGGGSDSKMRLRFLARSLRGEEEGVPILTNSGGGGSDSKMRLRSSAHSLRVMTSRGFKALFVR